MKKYRIYIDEVGNSDLKSSENEEHRYLCLTGVIFDLNYVKEVLFKELEELKSHYFDSHPDDPIILHRKELVYKKYPFHKLKDNKISKAFDTEILSKLLHWDYTVISVLIDKLEHKKKYECAKQS